MSLLLGRGEYNGPVIGINQIDQAQPGGFWGEKVGGTFPGPFLTFLINERSIYMYNVACTVKCGTITIFFHCDF